jgi:hypothetical protein
MSKIALSPNPSGSGTLTISAPNTNVDRVLDLPDAGGGFMVTGAVQTNTANKSFQSSNSVIGNSNGSLNTLEAIGTGGAAMMTFHRPGVYAAYFGLDTDNVFKIGGWSAGAVAQPLLYTGSTTAPGSAPVYACRAWVNFNGNTTTPTINASGNVSSVTRNGTGDFRINFTTAMPDASYAGVMNFDNFVLASALVVNYQTTRVDVQIVAPGVSFYNSATISVAIFR